MPNGTVAIGGTLANCIRQAATSREVDEEPAARQQQQAGIGRRERQHRHGKGRDQEGAAEQRRTGDEADDEGKAEIIGDKHAGIDQAAATGENLLPDKGQQGRRADKRQPDDARLLEPVPSAALAQNIGEREQRQ